MKKNFINTFYSFKPLSADHLESIRSDLKAKAQDHNIKGLIILGVEGLNTTLSSENNENLSLFVDYIKKSLELPDFDIKKSLSDKHPFRLFSVKIREEIVTIGDTKIVPKLKHKNHLSPEDWNKMLEHPEAVIIDTRNDYEYEVGTFKGALNLYMKEFSEFPDKVRELNTDKDKPHLIFCTGGIRCEKAIYEMENQGYKNVYQLDGGILNYLEQRPEDKFEGECFVFDSRVAVDQHLNPSQKYSLCPHCGDVSEFEINCRRCDSPSKLCKTCKAKVDSSEREDFETCSKNCQYHFKLHPERKGRRQQMFYHE